MNPVTSQLPNFLIVGAPKCGTTALYAYLSKHPQIFMPEVKEPYYYIQPKEVIGEGPADLGHRMFIDDESRYHGLFERAGKQHLAVGEASAGYLHFHELVIPRIRESLGDVKIIILLRDPVARAFSSHIHHVRKKRETESFQKAWDLQAERDRDGWWFGFQLKAVGLYAKSIAAYQQAFSEVKVILNDELNSRTEETVQSTLDFLGVDASQPLEVAERHNENRMVRHHSLKRVIRGLQRRGLLTEGLARKAHQLNSYRPRLDMGFASTIATEFRDDLEASSELIDRDLTFWLDRYQAD